MPTKPETNSTDNPIINIKIKKEDKLKIKNK